METLTTISLGLSALLLLFVGSSRLQNPKKTFQKSSGINLNDDKDLINELRGISGVMFLSSVLIATGIFIDKMLFTSLIIAVLIFIGFGIGRIFSILKDGKPNTQIMQGIGFEMVLGALNVACLIHLIG
jgi:hypothetical protein